MKKSDEQRSWGLLGMGDLKAIKQVEISIIRSSAPLIQSPQFVGVVQSQYLVRPRHESSPRQMQCGQK